MAQQMAQTTPNHIRENRNLIPVVSKAFIALPDYCGMCLHPENTDTHSLANVSLASIIRSNPALC